MSRLQQLFHTKKTAVLNIYCTAGFPQLDSTLPVMKALQEYGADIIELGMPFSDPLADGPVIQHSSSVAIANGMTIRKLFEQLQGFRNEIHLPVVLMGYMNAVLQYGFDRFGSDRAFLIEFEFETMYRPIVEQHGLDFIFLVTPETAAERIRKLDNLSSGFLYAVSSSSTTGSDGEQADIKTYLEQLRAMNLKNPILVGFGIRDKASFDAVCQLADGGIIGSAYIRALENSKDVNASTKTFLSSIRG